MNYIKTYKNICKNATLRNIEGYKEKHHIYPISIFGKNNKTVYLTAREHFICHFLLFKICKKRYGLNHYKTHKMGYAFYKMTVSSKNQTRYFSKSYEIAKKWYSENNPSKYRDLSGNKNPMFGRTGELHHLFGISCSQERKDKIGRANKGKLLGDKNPSKRQDVRDRISASWDKRNFQYTYITPWGNYHWATEAARNSPFKISSTSIRNWCYGVIPKEGFSVIKHW